MKKILFTVLVVVKVATYGQTIKPDSLARETVIPLTPELKEKATTDTEFGERLLKHQFDQKGFKQNEMQEFKVIESTQFKAKMVYPDKTEAGRHTFIYRDDSELSGGNFGYWDINPDPTEQNLASPPPIRDYDSRFEIANLLLTSEENQKVVTNSFSVLGLTSSSQLIKTETGHTIPKTVTLQQRFGLCPEEPYCEQPVVCTGTAFLIASDMVLTARHNLDAVPLQRMMFLLGYKILAESGKANLDFPLKDVYRAKKLIRSDKLALLDLAIIKLDRSVDGAIPLPIESDNEVKLKDLVYALGYPLGLPMKYITNASVSAIDGLSFYSTLDTFKGNSGSPVFNRASHKLIGVLVEGGIDLKSNGNCMVSNLCADRTCMGERVVNVSLINKEIQSLIAFNSPR